MYIWGRRSTWKLSVLSSQFQCEYKTALQNKVFLQVVKNPPACNVGDLGSVPELGRSLGEGNGYPLQNFGLENPMGCIVQEVAKSRT